MEKVTGFKTKDNRFFASEFEALAHERKLDFLNWYKKEGNKGLKVKGDVCIKWLLDNSEEVMNLLGESTLNMPLMMLDNQ